MLSLLNGRIKKEKEKRSGKKYYENIRNLCNVYIELFELIYLWLRNKNFYVGDLFTCTLRLQWINRKKIFM